MAHSAAASPKPATRTTTATGVEVLLASDTAATGVTAGSGAAVDGGDATSGACPTAVPPRACWSGSCGGGAPTGVVPPPPDGALAAPRGGGVGGGKEVPPKGGGGAGVRENFGGCG